MFPRAALSLRHPTIVHSRTALTSRPSLSPTARKLSNQTPPGSTPPPPNQNAKKTRVPDPAVPEFSFKGLSASRTVKTTVLVCLSILGTMETAFWIKVLWAKFYPKGEEGAGSAEGGG